MQELKKQPKTRAQQAFEDLPFWMRQMMRDKVQKCLAADANEQRQAAENSLQHCSPSTQRKAIK